MQPDLRATMRNVALVTALLAVLLGSLAGCGGGEGGAEALTGGRGRDALDEVRDEPLTQAVFEPDAEGRVRVLVLYKDRPEPAETAAVNAQGGRVNAVYETLPVLAATVPMDAIETLRQDPEVAQVVPDIRVRAVDAELDATWSVAKIGAGAAHSRGFKGAGVTVAVLDTGINYNHPDLSNRFGSYKGYDYANNDADPMDDHGHGTFVAGSVAASDNDSMVVGVAPEATLIAYKVLDNTGNGYLSWILSALEDAAQRGVKVTNNSYTAGADPGNLMRDAFNNATNMIHVAAAGNGYGGPVGYPAALDAVIAVSATTNTDQLANFSSVGPQVELAAPGAAVISTTRTGGTGSGSGTSFASPHVAGAVAVLLGAAVSDPRARLQQTAIDLGPSGRDDSFGYGRVDLAAALPPPSAALTVAITTDKATYPNAWEPLRMAVDVFDAATNKRVVGAAVTVKLHTPTGAVYTFNGTSGQWGPTRFTWYVKLQDGPGTCTLTATVTKDGYQEATATTTCWIGPGGSGGGDPPPPSTATMTVAVTTDKAAYATAWEPMRMAVDVFDAATNKRLAGAAVTVKLQTPKGSVYTFNGTGSQWGPTRFTWYVNPKEGSGTCTLTATVTKDGYQDATATTTCELN